MLEVEIYLVVDWPPLLINQMENVMIQAGNIRWRLEIIWSRSKPKEQNILKATDIYKRVSCCQIVRWQKSIFCKCIYCRNLFFLMNVKLNYWVTYGILVLGNKQHKYEFNNCLLLYHNPKVVEFKRSDNHLNHWQISLSLGKLILPGQYNCTLI